MEELGTEAGDEADSTQAALHERSLSVFLINVLPPCVRKVVA